MFAVYSTISQRILRTFTDKTIAEMWATQYRREHPGEPWYTVAVVSA